MKWMKKVIISHNQTDSSYKLNETNYSDSLEFSASDRMITAPLFYDIDRTYLNYENQLNLLLKFCPTCGSLIVDLHKFYCGSLIGVRYNCMNNCASTFAAVNKEYAPWKSHVSWGNFI